MTRSPLELRQLAGALDELAQKHSDEARQFRLLDLRELAERATARALTLRAAVTELVLMAECKSVYQDCD